VRAIIKVTYTLVDNGGDETLFLMLWKAISYYLRRARPRFCYASASLFEKLP
jgi:hypothetical protein